MDSTSARASIPARSYHTHTNTHTHTIHTQTRTHTHTHPHTNTHTHTHTHTHTNMHTHTHTHTHKSILNQILVQVVEKHITCPWSFKGPFQRTYQYNWYLDILSQRSSSFCHHLCLTAPIPTPTSRQLFRLVL